MSKTAIYWLLQIFGWFSYSIIQFLVLSYDSQPIDKMLVLGEGLQMMSNILLTHCFRLVIIRFKWLNFRLIKLIPLTLIGIFVLSLMGSIIWVVIMLIQNSWSFSELPLDIFAQAVVVSLIESIFLFSLWSFAYFVYLYFERYNKSLKYEASTREIELNNLKSQLNPHFIFNALNSIRALVDENPQKSKESITQLSHILRNSLNSDRQKLVPFSEEMRTVKDYLGLESIRYEERLRTKIDLVKGTEEFEVPPLMLQTLVENGIKHGVAKLKKGGEIRISTEVNDNTLHIAIRNSGQLNGQKGKGLGLKNTKRRLDMIYGNSASFQIKNEDNKTVLTEITIPK